MEQAIDQILRASLTALEKRKTSSHQTIEDNAAPSHPNINMTLQAEHGIECAFAHALFHDKM